MAVTALVVYGLWAALAFGWRAVVQRRRTGDTGFRGFSGRVGSVEWGAGILFLVAIVAGVAAPIADLSGVLEPVTWLENPWIAAVGLVVAMVGVMSTFAAQLAMGDSWRVGVDTTERTSLVTDGPFALARNPIFTAMLLTAAGLALMVPNVVALAGLVGVLVGLEMQVRVVEEPYLSRAHGSAYDRYAARVGRFVPGLGRLPARPATEDAGREKAIVFLDLARFTTLTDIHGDTTAVEVLDRFMACVDEAMSDRASLIKTLGDGALIAADTAAEAITVAIRIIERFHDEPGLPDVAGGIHVGPVIERDGDVLGATVNLASRLAEAAGPAEVRATREVATAASELGVPVQPLGQVTLRGVLEPVAVYAIHPCTHDDATVIDPVCGMRLVPGTDAARSEHLGGTYWFCADHCRERFAADPSRFVAST